MPVLMGWRDFFDLRAKEQPGNDAGPSYMDPMKTVDFFRKRYGQQ